MGFQKRITIAREFIKALSDAYWNTEEIKKRGILHIPYGYEQTISFEAVEILKTIYTKTSMHIRFTPDFILLQKGNEKVFLYEYKVMRTPRFSLKDLQWDVGQIEANAWENYINLINAGINVAIIIYCPYHSRPLLCNVVNPKWITGERTKVKKSMGSGTDYVNIDLLKITPFEFFMEKYFNVSITTTYQLLFFAGFFKQLKNNKNLTTKHSEKSPYYKNNAYQTGFNWLRFYK